MRKPLVVLAALAAAVALVAAAAQAGTRKAEVTNVTLAGWSSGPDEDALVQQMVAAFNKTHPTIHATFSVINGNYVEAMTARFAARNPPDVFYVDSSVAPGWMGQGVLEPLNGFVKKSKYDTKPFYPGLLKAFMTGKTIYGFPKDWSPLAVEVNKAMFAKVGGPVPKTWASLQMLAQKMKDAGVVPNGKPVCIGADWARMLPFVFQNGGSLCWVVRVGAPENGRARAQAALPAAADKAVEAYRAQALDGVDDVKVEVSEEPTADGGDGT